MMRLTFLSAIAALTSLVAAQAPYYLPPTPAKGTVLNAPPQLGLGTWYMKGNTSEAIATAMVTGYRHFDCAKVYGNQKDVGRGIALGLKRTGLTRKDIWVTSKLWNSDHGNPESALRSTLSDLGLEYLDLYLMHFPVGGAGRLDYVNTYTKMEKLVGKGTRFIGIANHSPSMVEKVLQSAKIKPLVHQFEGHPYLRQDAFIQTNFKHNITVVNYAPLANTSPTYASTGASAPKILTANKVIKDIATARKCTPAQVVLGWNMQRKVIVIPKAIKKTHQDENYATSKCKLEPADIQKIQAMTYKIRMLSYPCATAANACFAGL